MAKYYGVKSRVIARQPWTCDGCGRRRPESSSKFIMTEGAAIVAQLCVFCTAKPELEPEESIVTEAAHAGGCEDPFDWGDREIPELWEEVFGGLVEAVEEELAAGNPSDFPQSSRTEREAGLTLESPNPQG